ncbi:MAG: purine-nucleoside phosphorylase [Bacteroidota bacterium]
MFDKIQEAVGYIKSKINSSPSVGIVLGTGLGSLKESIQLSIEIPYSEIPNFPESTVESHEGKMLFGKLSGVDVVMMAGRFHYYEGYALEQIVFPIRVMKFLGIEKIIMSNAAGGLNPNFEAGDLVMVKDHINLQGVNPLRGQNDERIGLRFPDMLHTYDKAFIEKAISYADANNIRIHSGVYASLQGPSLETPAEYNMLHLLGADLVGMSTVPEVIAAKHLDLKIAVISIVSNVCYPLDQITETTLEEVIEVVNNASAKARQLVENTIHLF